MLLPNDPDWNERIKDAARTKLSAILTPGIREIGYVYDMGDNWQHVVQIEKEVDAETDARYPRCIAGKRACPPEDCGGPGGFEDLKELLAGPPSAERDEMLEWADDDYDPARFDLAAANAAVAAV